jgi:hypothetical protein
MGTIVHQFSFSVYGALLLDIIFLNLKASSFGGGSVPPRGGLKHTKNTQGVLKLHDFHKEHGS